MSTPSGQLPPFPSKPPAASGNLGAILRWCFTKFLQKVDSQLPAEVISYDRVKNRAMVQPLISMITTSGQRVGRAPIVSVPVLALGGGGFFVNFPLVKGSLGWIEASDRDISLFLQKAQMQPPNSKRLHSFEDCRFIPDVYGQYTFTPDAGAMVIASMDGTTQIALSPGKIKMVSTVVEIDSTTFTLNNSGAATINTATWNVNTTGGAGSTSTGVVNLPATTIIDGRAFPTHEHSGVQPGSGNTGGIV
jgi:hypothetical protein